MGIFATWKYFLPINSIATFIASFQVSSTVCKMFSLLWIKIIFLACVEGIREHLHGARDDHASVVPCLQARHQQRVLAHRVGIVLEIQFVNPFRCNAVWDIKLFSISLYLPFVNCIYWIYFLSINFETYCISFNL